MAGKHRVSCVDTFQRVNEVAYKLCMSPSPEWDKVDDQALILRSETLDIPSPNVSEMLFFLGTIPRECSIEFFKSLEILMVITTTTGQTFFHIMGYFKRMENSLSGRVSDEVPPPSIPGMPAPRYSIKRWEMLMHLHQFQTSLRPITMRYVLSSRDMMMTSSNARLGFDFRCIMHGSNPRLKLRTVSPGIFLVFLRNFLADAAKSGQTIYLHRIIDIFAQFYGLDPIMLRNMSLNMLRKI